jgi:hypothetical protein
MNMKKLTILLSAVALSVTANAQDLTNKKGESILPQQGDWAIGINADPFLNYFGNIFNGNTNNAAPTLQYVSSPWAVTGKKFISDKEAWRAKVRIGIGSVKQAQLVEMDLVNTTTTDTTKMVEDLQKTSSHNIGLGFGKEWRRGKTRLQGFYGWEGMLWLIGGKTKYEYGNELSADNTAPTSYDFSGGTSGAATIRTTERKNGNTFGFGVRGFIGAEYFILPKISIGAEYGWGLGFASTSEGSKISETWDSASGQIKTIEERTSGRSSSWGFDTDINGKQGIGTGSLMITLHF